MRDTALQTIRKYQMFTAEDTAVLCVSGGADSMALLHFVQHNACACGLRDAASVVCCHFHHGLRGEEADADAALVENTCRAAGIPYYFEKTDLRREAAERGMGLEECGRLLRYAFFERVASQFSHSVIVTAHTLSDSVETVLFHLARGTGLSGLGGIPAVRGNVVRPLIGCTRAQIEDYCVQNGIAYRTDSSNLSDAFSRNRIRHTVVPALQSINPAAEEAVGLLAERARQIDDFLHTEAQALLARAAGERGYDTALLAAAHPALRDKALMLLAAAHGVGGQQVIDSLRALLREEKTVQLSGTVRARCQNGKLDFLIAEPPPAAYELPLREGRFAVGAEKSLLVRIVGREVYEKFKNNPEIGLKNFLDYDKISDMAIFTPRRPGDRLRPVGRGCGKSLKKLLNETHLPPAERDRLVTLRDACGLLWLEGFGADERAAVTDTTQHILWLKIE